MRSVGLLMLVLGVGAAHADHVDRTRGLLYRIDAEARVVRLHPEQSWNEASSASRTAGDAADQLRAHGMPDAATALRAETNAMATAARRSSSPPDARAHAIVVEQMVRQIDEALPPHEVIP